MVARQSLAPSERLPTPPPAPATRSWGPVALWVLAGFFAGVAFTAALGCL